MSASGRIIRRNGGGASLAYSWVNAASYGALPASADGTIGIITAVPITKVFVSNDRPSGRPTGEVRIKVGSISNRALTVIADPLVSVYPISVFQYDGAGWVMREAYLRASSAWKQIRSEFYNAGTVSMIGSLTGYRYNISSTSFTIGASSFTIALLDASPNANFVCVYGNVAIDVTNLTTLKISYSRVRTDYSGAHKARIYLNPTPLTGINSAFSEGAGGKDIPVGVGTVEFDVSGISGFQMIHVGLGRTTYFATDTIVVTQIYGE